MSIAVGIVQLHCIQQRFSTCGYKQFRFRSRHLEFKHVTLIWHILRRYRSTRRIYDLSNYRPVFKCVIHIQDTRAQHLYSDQHYIIYRTSICCLLSNQHTGSFTRLKLSSWTFYVIYIQLLMPVILRYWAYSIKVLLSMPSIMKSSWTDSLRHFILFLNFIIFNQTCKIHKKTFKQQNIICFLGPGTELDEVSPITGRSYYVNFNGVSSTISHLVCGVPQGSILGPLFSYCIHQNSSSIIDNLGAYFPSSLI